MMSRIPLLMTVGLALGMCGAVQAAPKPGQTTVQIIGFNDFHGNMQSPGNFGGGPAGGIDVLATYIETFRAANKNTVVVSAGDLINASPLTSALFHDEGTIETMNRAGLDFAGVGNHEFDEGSTELQRMREGGCHPTDPSTCEGATVGTPVPFEGANFKYLAANVVVTKTGKTLFPAYAIKNFAHVRVAFIGLTLEETPTIVTPTGVAGLTFLDEADTVNALVPELRERGVEAIVVVIHHGGFQGPTTPNFINDCSAELQDDVTSPIRSIVERLDGEVDLVISGHTHTGYNCLLPNSVGRRIPVTQASAFGRVLTDVDMTVDNVSGEVTNVAVNNVIVSRTGVTPNETVASIVNGYAALASPIANQIIGYILPPGANNTPNAAGEMPAGKLIADAQLAATTGPVFGNSVVAFMNAGGVRTPGFTTNTSAGVPDPITYGETFTVQPFGNALVTMTLTHQKLRDLLEEQFPGCLGQIQRRVMQVSAGFVYSYQEANACGERIREVTLNGTPIMTDGIVHTPSATIRITVNNFMSPGGDNFFVLRDFGTDLVGGPQDLDVLAAYLAQFTITSPYDAAAVPNRITALPALP